MRVVRSLKSHPLTTLRMTYGSLVTKTDPDLATCPLSPTKPHKAEKKLKSKSKKKCKPNKLIRLTKAVRRAEKTIETDAISNMNFGNELKDDSSPNPSLPQLNASAGCEPEVQRDLTITAQLTGQDTGSLVAIFSTTATITNLITFATRRDRPYIVLPNQLTVNQKDLSPMKKRTNQMLRGPHHNSRVRKTPQPNPKLLQRMKPTQTSD